MQKVLAKLQKLGKALMLPVACLPVAGILMGIGYMIDSNVMTRMSLLSSWLKLVEQLSTTCPFCLQSVLQSV